MAFWGLAGPAGQSLMTSRLAQDEQGRLQGGLSSLMGVAGMIGPGLFTQTFAAFIDPRRNLQLPGAPMLVAAVLLVAAIFVAWRATQGTQRAM
jgi:DHA1 family tetracycline resistance protein-like MFS transporter